MNKKIGFWKWLIMTSINFIKENTITFIGVGIIVLIIGIILGLFIDAFIFNNVFNWISAIPLFIGGRLCLLFFFYHNYLYYTDSKSWFRRNKNE